MSATPDSPEWHEMRRSGLGGSDIATVLGLNPYEPPSSIWRLKRGLDAPWGGNEATRRGQELESTVLDRLCARAGVERGPGVAFVRHPRWDAGVKLLANLDGTVESGGILEAKTTHPTSGTAHAYRRGAPPLAHVLQVHHYAACTQRTWGLLGCLIGAGEPGACELVALRFEMHPVLIQLLEEAAVDWWRLHIDADVPPADARHPLALEISRLAGEIRFERLPAHGANQ